MAKQKKIKPLNFEISLRLRQERVARGCTQENFAETLNISVEHYRKIESGAYRLNVEKFVILYREYGIDPTYLLVGKYSGEVICPEEDKATAGKKHSGRVSSYGSKLV